MRCYGEPEYLALAVALKESGLRFFWHRELEELVEGPEEGQSIGL